MTNAPNLLFKDIEGKWIYHQTFYCLINKVIKVNKQNVHITKLNSFQKKEYINQRHNYIYKYKKSDNKKFIYQYLCKQNPVSASGTIQKTGNFISIQYDFQSYGRNYLKIGCNNKEIKYSEYIYTINNNLRISIIIVKKLNRCLAISFTSQIKIKL